MCEMSMDEIMTLSGERFEECLQGNVFFQPPKRSPGVFKLEPLEHVGTLENMGETPYHPGNTVLSVWGGAAKIRMNHPTYLPSFIAPDRVG